MPEAADDEDTDEKRHITSELASNVVVPPDATVTPAMSVASTPQSGETAAVPAEVSDSPQNCKSAPVEEEQCAAKSPLPPVQVCVRVRPLLSWERESGHTSSSLEAVAGPKGTVSLRPREGSDETNRTRNFRFDSVLSSNHSQQDAWEFSNVEGLVDKVVGGFNATVFAYGQTGSGKTHTMEGYTYSHHNGSSAPSADAGRAKVRLRDTPPEQLGIVPRAVATLFARIDALQAKAGADDSFTVKVSFLQIYKERIYDLLNPVHTLARQECGKGDEVAGLRLRWHPVRRQFYVENLFEYECSTADEVLEHYGTGIKNKHVASTAMNVASSRSHTVLMISFVRCTNLNTSSAANDTSSVRSVVSRLALVDLAGSERASASSGVEKGAARFQEAVNINQSLFVLRKVITALSRRPSGEEAGSHVPYRESKLTSLLQHSIGGNSFLLMVACLSPSDKHYEENLSTLQYASHAANIKNTPTLNLDPKDRLIQQLRAQLEAAHAYILRELRLTVLPPELLNVNVGAACRRGGAASLCSAAARSNSKRRQPGTADTAAPLRRTIGYGGVSEFSNAQAQFASLVADGFFDGSRAGSATSSTPLKPRGSSKEHRRPLSDGHCTDERQQLFSAAASLLASYGADAPDKGRRSAIAAQAPATARTPRSKDKGHGHTRPPSLPPAGCGLPPISAEGQRRQQPRVSVVRSGSKSRPDDQAEKEIEERRTPPAALESTPSTTATSSSSSPAADPSAVRLNLAEIAAQRYAESGLWEAIEELRQAKSTLEGQLEESQARAAKLQARLDAMESSRIKAPEECEVVATSLAATSAVAVGDGNLTPTSKVADAQDAVGTVQAANSVLQAENERLRLESRNLMERLEIFYSAMELETRTPSAECESRAEHDGRPSTAEVSASLSGSSPAMVGGGAGGNVAEHDGLAARVERLHARLVQEALALRTEVAGLKKKKWILQAIANGGENEQRAIDEEVEELRRSRRETKNKWTVPPLSSSPQPAAPAACRGAG